MNLTYILTGGFLAGYRTYLLTALAVATVAVEYATGQMGLADAITAAALALGLSTVRAAK